MFLASPLQGTRAGNAAQWHVMIAAILNRNPSQTLLQDLDGSTKALRETSEKFIKMATTTPMQIMTICFWESRKTQVLRAILPARALTLFSNSKIIVSHHVPKRQLGLTKRCDTVSGRRLCMLFWTPKTSPRCTSLHDE